MNTVGQVQIYNMALAAIGINRPVQDLQEGSPQASVCNLFWPSARDQVLQAFPWGFAMRYVDLELIDKTIRNWLYCYALPADCLQARLLVPYRFPGGSIGSATGVIAPGYQQVFYDFWGLWHSDKKIPFVLTENESGGGIALATNEPSAVLAYTARIETVALWSPAFVNALTWLLASKIVSPLAAQPKYAETAGKAYQAALLEAGSLSLNESSTESEPESMFIEARD